MTRSSRYRHSGEVPWDVTRRETYRSGWFGFDVQAAKVYLAHHRIPIQHVPLGELDAWIQPRAREPENPNSGRLDPSCLSGSDPSVPLLFVETPRGGFLIDGNHRLEAARVAGAPVVPVVVLRNPAIGRRISRGLTIRPVHWWLWRGSDKNSISADS
ncbi:MAG: hypothetical protein L3J93_02950 [Thermoplasmata archaeon]|nr:hypothetical protein [Thermoplasmata archaeon]